MSSSRFEHAADSSVLGSVDSGSVPSEPPDLRNWFSSYICDESTELNTLDVLQDFNGFRENQPACRSNYVLPSSKRKSPDKVTFSSESISFSSAIPSEPPDINNWFSSYLYESPPLNTTDEFTVSDYKVREDGNLCNVEESIEFTNLAKDTKLNYQPLDKDVHRVSKRLSPRQRTENNHIGHVEKLGHKNTYGKGNNEKLNFSLLEKTIPKLPNNIISQDVQDGHESIGRKDCVTDSLEKEDLREITSPGTLISTVPEEDSGKRPSNRRRNGKENKQTESLENGFVSVSKENEVDLTRPVRVQSESLRQRVQKPALVARKNADISRKVLSETSNFLSHGKLECTGKWCCPQKNKPNLGPPLKQLRLEQWVRRV